MPKIGNFIYPWGNGHYSRMMQINSQMSVNYMGTVRCTKAFLPGMLERRLGKIINVASVGASIGVPGLAPYCASKFAILGFFIWQNGSARLYLY